MRRNAQANFDQMADAVAATLPNTIDDMNVATQFVAARATAAEQAASAAEAAAGAAAQSAEQAHQQVGIAAEQAELAASNGAAQVQLAAQQAARSEQAAEQAQLMASAAGAAAGLPAMQGNGGRLLVVKLDESGAEYREQYPAMANKGGRSLIVKPDCSGVMFADPTPVADVLITARDPGSDYLRADGSIYLKATHPALAAKVGTVGGAVGAQWAAMAGGPTTIHGLATDHKGVWVALSGRFVWRSEDDGLTWTSQEVLSASTFSGGDIATDGRGKWIAAAYADWVATSLDNGRTWTTTVVSGHNTCRSLDTDGQGTWMLVTYSTALATDRTYRLIDGGSWVVVSSSAYEFCAHAGGTIWLAGDSTNGVLKRSVDNGQTWNTVATGITTRVRKTAKSRTTPGVIIAAGESGKAARSEDYGVTWAAVDPKSGTATLRFIAVGPDGVVILFGGAPWSRSSDDGKTWAYMPSWTSSGVAVLSDTGVGIKGSTPERSVPSYPYDPATQFAVPKVAVPVGMRAYIRARADQ
jgi:hypothetical protein